MKFLGPVPTSAALEYLSASSVTRQATCFRRGLHYSTPRCAIPYPATVTGPAPPAPSPPASQYRENVQRRLKQAQLLKQGQELRASQAKTRNPLKKRFWNDVHVRTEPDGSRSIYLDTRPLRTSNKSPLLIPPSKPHLASALALEWSLLTSNQQALKHHLIPLTSLCSRALDVSSQDAIESPHRNKIRQDIVTSMIRYLDTDTLLCWSPARSVHDAVQLEQSEQRGTQTLRDVQIRTTLPIISYLIEHVWPGVEIKPILESDSIIPSSHPQSTRDVIRGWISGLGPWELAGLERAVLATKSLCVGTRLMVDWSEAFRDVQIAAGRRIAQDGSRGSLQENTDKGLAQKFGTEEAAEACSLEVSWQTGMWGEVEDTHDVEKEDLKRQLGSAILVVSGSN